MTWAVDWSRACERDVLSMDWKVAAAACEAVYLLAGTGTGRVEADAIVGRYRLRVGRAVVLMRIDKTARKIHVDRIFVR